MFLIKFYKVISFLNCIKKLVEKVVIEKLLQFYKTYLKLYKKQIKAQKNMYIINTIIIIINNIYKI